MIQPDPFAGGVLADAEAAGYSLPKRRRKAANG